MAGGAGTRRSPRMISSLAVGDLSRTAGSSLAVPVWHCRGKSFVADASPVSRIDERFARPETFQRSTLASGIPLAKAGSPLPSCREIRPATMRGPPSSSLCSITRGLDRKGSINSAECWGSPVRRVRMDVRFSLIVPPPD